MEEQALTITSRDDTFAPIRRAAIADSTKAQYERALARFFRETGSHVGDTEALAAHAETLPKSGRAFLKAAVRLLTEGAAQALKSQATPENVDAVQAALYRIEAIQGAVQVSRSKGTKAHVWLNQEEVRRLDVACGNGICGLRDRVLLGLLVAAGLRRAEAADLEFSDLKRQGERWVLEIRGKGSRHRVVPIKDGLVRAIDEWGEVVSREGKVCRSLGMDREPGRSISGQGILDVVRKRGRAIGRPELRPHDLRRTWAQMGYDAGIPLVQLAVLLGHSDVRVTQGYLNLDVDLDVTVSDFVPFC